jgi:hypothetical protein
MMSRASRAASCFFDSCSVAGIVMKVAEGYEESADGILAWRMRSSLGVDLDKQARRFLPHHIMNLPKYYASHTALLTYYCILAHGDHGGAVRIVTQHKLLRMIYLICSI